MVRAKIEEGDGPLSLAPLDGGPLEDHRANFRALRWLLGGILEPFGLVVTDYQALRLASRGPTRPTDISQYSGISPAATTELLDRLESRGLVTRSPDPGDRRSTQIMLTSKGERLQREAALAYRRFLDGVIAEMSRDSLVALRKGSQELRTILERRAAGSRPVH
jgi:DNA-binding MarR family transcriptional regulator